MPLKAFFHRHIFVSYIWILAIRDRVCKFQTSEIQTVQSKVYEVMAGVNKPKDKLTLPSVTFDRGVRSHKANLETDWLFKPCRWATGVSSTHSICFCLEMKKIFSFA